MRNSKEIGTKPSITKADPSLQIHSEKKYLKSETAVLINNNLDLIRKINVKQVH